jgi:hypothetical protein
MDYYKSMLTYSLGLILLVDGVIIFLVNQPIFWGTRYWGPIKYTCIQRLLWRMRTRKGGSSIDRLNPNFFLFLKREMEKEIGGRIYGSRIS